MTWIITLLSLLLSSLSPALAGDTHTANPRQLTVLAMNDIYRLDNLAYVRGLRRQLEAEVGEVLLLHAGDFLFPSLLSRRFDGAQMIDVLNNLDGDDKAFDPRLFITFGNHEFDKSRLKHASMLQSRIRESQFTWLNSNVEFRLIATDRPIVQAEQMLPSHILEVNGIRVGLLGVVTDVKQADYIERFLSPEKVLREGVIKLRKQGAEVVIAVTHLNMREDQALLQNLGDNAPDLMIGGHEHDRQTALVNGRRVVKADADAKTVAVVQIRPDQREKNGLPDVQLEYVELPGTVQQDTQLQQRITTWKQRFEQAYCADLKEPGDCMSQVLGTTQPALIAEELRIRRFETNLGNWLADLARQAFADKGAQIAFLNSGGMRLNQNLPASSQITRQHMDTLFAYPTRLVMIQLTGAQLQQVVEHAVSDWSGNGHWLQISGFAFQHDPEGEQARALHLITPSGLKAISPDDELVAVVNDYLIDENGDQDGYTMLGKTLLIEPQASRPDLKAIAIQALRNAVQTGINPQRDGRICNVQAHSHCLVQ